MKTKKSKNGLNKRAVSSSSKGVKRTLKETIADRKRHAFKLYLANKTLQQIADEVGSGVQTIFNWAKAGSWKDIRELSEENFKARVLKETVAGNIADVREMERATTKLVRQCEEMALLPGEKLEGYKEAREWLKLIKTLTGELSPEKAEALKGNNFSITQKFAEAAAKGAGSLPAEGEKK